MSVQIIKIYNEIIGNYDNNYSIKQKSLRVS